MKWGDDDLSKYLTDAHENQRVSGARFPARYATVLEIDECLRLAGRHLTNAKPVLTGVLLLRCFFAYRAAVGLAMAGQVVDAFPLMRSTLEYAGYCLLIHKDPQLETVFANRHMSAAEKAEQRRKFQNVNVEAAIRAADPKLGAIFTDLYQRAVDFGGHPNPHALFSALDLKELDDSLELVAYGLANDPVMIEHAIKSVAQAGLTALHVLQHVFPAKFQLLGIRERVERLRTQDGL